MPIKIRADADENCADVTLLPVLRDGELDLDDARILCSTTSLSMVWAAPPFHRRGERTIGEVVATASGDERVDIGHVLLAADVTVVDS
jgi:hypothetical protein